MTGNDNTSEAGHYSSTAVSDTAQSTPPSLETDLESVASGASLSDLDIPFAIDELATGNALATGEEFDEQREAIVHPFGPTSANRLSDYTLALQNVVGASSHVEEDVSFPLAAWLNDSSDAYILRLNNRVEPRRGRCEAL